MFNTKNKLKRLVFITVSLVFVILSVGCSNPDIGKETPQIPEGPETPKVETPFYGADPFIMFWEGKYYLYPTAQGPNDFQNGYKVYVSEDLESWECKGYALHESDVMGESGFWAPDVMHRDGKFYMVYTADEHIGIAVADSPLGPFRQTKEKWLSEASAIDGHFFTDDDGTVYLYYVRFDRGNKIYASKLSDDLMTLDEENEVLLISAEDEWETRDGSVVEGAFVIKHNGLYYLSYSANNTSSPDYAIGYAVSESPMGPFRKFEGNPILKRTENVVGVGHHSFARLGENKWVCAYHSHFSPDQFKPRRVRVDFAEFVKDEKGGDDILVINGPTED